MIPAFRVPAEKLKVLINCQGFGCMGQLFNKFSLSPLEHNQYTSWSNIIKETNLPSTTGISTAVDMVLSAPSPRGTPSRPPSRQSTRIITPSRTDPNFIRPNKDSRKSLTATSRTSSLQTDNEDTFRVPAEEVEGAHQLSRVLAAWVKLFNKFSLSPLGAQSIITSWSNIIKETNLTPASPSPLQVEPRVSKPTTKIVKILTRTQNRMS
ncbi:hypothetical protein PSTT_13485, partial [Puccinia striiformis]